MSAAANKAVFLSYASQDAEAARRIADALRAAGVEVWFDQNELVGGDAWDAKIRGQISSCALFVPVISAATQARGEGYFRLEWKLAVDRSHLMASDQPFLLPVVIDATADAAARVPAEFRAVQWTRLAGGETPEKFCARVGKLLGGSEPVGAALRRDSVEPSRHKAAPTTRPSWLVPVILGVVAAAVLALWQPWKVAAVPPAVAKSVESVKPSAPFTEAQKLVAQAQKVYENSDELDRETLILADDLVKRALALDAAEPSAWLLGAQLSYFMVWQSFDMSEARKADLQRQAARARALAPESVPAQLAVADARVAVAYSNFRSASNRQDLASVEQDLLALAERAPRDYQVQRTLAQTYRFLKRPDDALRALRRAFELSDGNPAVSADMINVNLRRKNYAEAEAIMAPALARRPTGRLMVFDVFVKTRWRGDMDAAQAALARWPGWLLREDRGAFIAWQTWLWSRQPDRALDVAQRLPRDYLHDVWFTGPRAVLTARAHEMAGHREAASADWRTVVRLADQELAGSPDDVPAMFWKAWALSRLGDQTGAEAVCTLLQQRVTTQTVFLNSTNLSLLWSTMGRTDLAAAHLRAGFGADDDTYAVTRAMLELDPAYESLRQDSQFAGLATGALAPAAPAAPAATAAPMTKADDKSVAVLAFANLSDDKGNEYFSDGISEELLNVLAKIPGLKVSARTSAFYFKGKEVPIPEIAKQLGVAYVVEGSVRKAGDRVRITAQLIKAADGFHVWSETFTRDLKDIFAVQDEIAGLVAKNLELKMGITAARPTVDLEAYQEFLAGRAAAAKASHVDLREAVGHFAKAVEIDPNFAAAWVQLASAHTRLGRWGGTASLPAWASARSAIDRARALEPDSPDMLLALGWIQRTGEWDWRGAEKSFRRALEIRPAHADTLAASAVLLFNVGKADEAFRQGQQAAQLDPLNGATQIDLSLMFYFNGNWTEAEQSARRALQLAPGGAGYHAIVAFGLVGQKRYAEAEAEIALEDNPIEAQSAAGLLALSRGQAAAARQSLEQLENIARTNRDAADLQMAIAWIRAGLGDMDGAFAALEVARASRDPSMSWLRNGPHLRALHSDPRWAALVRKIGLADDQLK